MRGKVRKHKKMQRRGTWIRKLVFLIGFGICMFPVISNGIVRQRQANAVATYQQTVEKEAEENIEKIWNQAKAYNERIFQLKGGQIGEIEEWGETYEQQLNMYGTDIMGSLDIPKIQVELPIYHGTTEEVLSNGIGHLEGTSLPIGGENTHSVLTGHRGLPSSKLLVRLDEMKEGDLFFIHTYKEILAYEVDKIRVVKPEDTSWEEIQSGEDRVSIVTCTPYGINSHRLIVTGHRVVYTEGEHRQIKQEIPSVRELLITGMPMLFACGICGMQIKNRIKMWKSRKRKVGKNKGKARRKYR